uniref:Chalcone/stilbene synthase N-terminal domain-containing protein n=1 Tax=Leersia perrieri TaxID=77586 RepID=A0A0D9W2J9_9ORYZ
MIEKRYMYMSDEFLRSNPSVTAYNSPSINIRQSLTDATMPLLGAAAARRAIADWGQPASKITHLVMCTTVSGCMPGADFSLVKLLNLPLTTKRFMMYHAGCHGGGTALRLAENNPQSCTRLREERINQMVVSRLREEGIVYNLHRDLAFHIAANIEALMRKVIGALVDLNEEVFWVVHPGGRDILDRVARVLGLRDEKVAVSRERRSVERGMRTAGEGLELGLLLSFGPGLTMETILLRAPPIRPII